MVTATTRGQEERVSIILQMIPKEQAIVELKEEERRTLAKDLLRELVEVAQEEGLQGCELRFIKVSDSITKIMAENGEEMPWDEVEAWRLRLHLEFDEALAQTDLPERPDYQRANDFLVKARRLAIEQELP